jgi:quercetin dioxygenase-like cupin family protein
MAHQATLLGPTDGEEFLVGPLTIRSRVGGSQTGEAFEMYELALGTATIEYHVHDRMDETICVLEGEIEFVVEGERFTRPAGSVAFVPRGLHHGFSNRGPARARVLLVFAPATHQEEYFRALREALAGGYATSVEELQRRYDQVLVPMTGPHGGAPLIAPGQST